MPAKPKIVDNMKQCSQCKIPLPLGSFPKHKDRPYGRSKCNSCTAKNNKARYHRDIDKRKAYAKANRVRNSARAHELYVQNKEINRVKRIYTGARNRANKNGYPFNITIQDIVDIWPEDNKCPILGAVFEMGNEGATSYSATLDKIIPELGYIPSNIAIISFKANAMKQDIVDPELFIKLSEWLKSKLKTASSK